MHEGWKSLVGAVWNRRVADINKYGSTLDEWFASPRGQVLLTLENRLLRTMRASCDPASQLVVSAYSQWSQLPDTAVAGSLFVNACPPASNNRLSERQCAARLENLPFREASLDRVVLHHCLEFSKNPHRALNEAVRVLAPEGQLVILGFNPYSVFGAAMAGRRLLGHSIPSSHHPLSAARVSDWLHLKSLEPIGLAKGFYLPLLPSAERTHFVGALEYRATRCRLIGGGFYILQAKKRVFNRNIQPRRARGMSHLLPVPAAHPAAWYSDKHGN